MRRSILTILILGCLFTNELWGHMDSLSTLPIRHLDGVESNQLLTLAGKHPSEYEFVLQDPEQEMLEAWLKGDFEPLDGIVSEPDPDSGSKGQMFANTQEAIGRARAVIKEVEKVGAFISKFDESSLVNLPVALADHKSDGTEFMVVIDRITLYPEYASLNVFAKVKTPDMESALYFGAPDIKFSRKGGVQVGSLGLLGDFEITILEGKAFLTFAGAQVHENNFTIGQGNYVTFDCNGLEGFNLDVELAFSQDVIIPVDQNGAVIEGKRVEADLTIGATNGLNDLWAEINLESQPFASTKKSDIIWTVGKLIFDFSESRHHGFSFPVAEYEPILPDISLWKGVYLEDFSIKFPEQFGEGTNAEKDFEIGAFDVIIDQNGFTGYIEVSGFLTLEQGNMDGWPFSVDLFQLHLYRNQIAALKFNGAIDVPLFSGEGTGTNQESEQNVLEYLADFDIKDDQYLFSINTSEDIVRYSKMLKANFTLYNTSKFEVIYSQANGFDITATLNGSIEVDADFGNTQLNIPGIGFDSLQISNKGPFIKNPGIWDLSGDEVAVDLGGFELLVTTPTLERGKTDNEVELKFIGGLNLNIGSGLDVSSKGGFRIIGKIEANDGEKQNWRYENFKVDMIQVSAEKPGAFAFNGFIVFFENLPSPYPNVPDYGSGFQGLINLSIEKLKVEVAASALFGSSNGTNYYFVDAMAFANINLGSIDLKAIGGGVYNNMEQLSTVEDFSNTPEAIDIPENPNKDAASLDAYELLIANWVGKSLSGIQYVVSPGKFGLNAGVVLATPINEETFNANVNLNLQFNKSNAATGEGGGLDKLTLNGFANIMAPISWTGPACDGLSIAVKMEYVTGEDPRLHAEAHAFLNLYDILVGDSESEAPSDMLEGIYTGTTCPGLSYAGGVDILFETANWHVWVGTPSPEVFGETDKEPDTGYPGPIAVKLKGFITEVSALAYFDIGTQIPPFPGLPQKVNNLTQLGNLLKNESQRGAGGFMFGAGFDIKNELNAFGIFRASLELGVGFDVMLRKFNDAICVNNDNRELGINGWYAAGQAWAYVAGMIGVGKFTIFDIALGAAIQLKGPIPTYGRGAVGGKFKILGGLIKGRCRFPVTFGKECELEDGGELEVEYDLIADLSPFDQSEQVPVEVMPELVLNHPIGEIFELDNANGEKQKWVLELDKIELMEGQSVVIADLIWDESHQFAEYLPQDFLKANTSYTLEAQVSIYSVDDNNNKVGNAIDTDTKQVTFTTGDALTYIPQSNIALAYPANGQFNYYENESNANFIQLERGQDELLENQPIEVFVSIDEAEHEINAVYNTTANQIVYTLPDLEAGGAYHFGVRMESSLDTLLSGYFRVSRYPTFAAKMQNASVQSMVLVDSLSNYSDEYVADLTGLLEPFGKEEIYGLDQLESPILSVADLENTLWMDHYINRNHNGNNINFYEDCSEMNVVIQKGSRSVFGNGMPVYALGFIQRGAEKCEVTASNYLSLNLMKNSLNPIAEVGTPGIHYFAPGVVKQDLLNLQYELLYGGSNFHLNLQKAIVEEGLDGNMCYEEESNKPNPDYGQIEDILNELISCCKGENSVGLTFFPALAESQVDIKYGSSSNCLKALLKKRDGDFCDNLEQPVVKRYLSEVYVSIDHSSIYPIYLQYQIPNQFIGTSYNINLNFGTQ